MTKICGVVEVLEGKNKRQMDENFSYSFFCNKTFALEKLEEKDSEVDEEGVPHHGKGEDGPHDVSVPQKVKEGEQVSPHVSEWNDRVKEPKKAHFQCH